MERMVSVRLAGEITFAEPLKPSRETVSLPQRLIEPHEKVYRLLFGYQHARPGDLLIVEPRTAAASGETVMVTFEGRIYIGYWWTKHERQELIIDDVFKPMASVQILGAINQIIRL